MVTSAIELPDISTQLARFSLADAAIAEMQQQFMPLSINGIEDAEGYKRVHAARMTVKGHRVEVEKLRKELKADALEYGRKVDGEAKRITALLAPIESHLEAEEKAIDDAKEAIRNAARLKAEAEERARREAEEAERKAKQEAEAAALREEREKLEAERRVMEAERRKIEEAAAIERQRIAAEQARVQAEQRAAQQKMEADAARIAAEQKAAQEKIDAERRAMEAEQKRLADEAAAKAKQEAKQEAKPEAKPVESTAPAADLDFSDLDFDRLFLAGGDERPDPRQEVFGRIHAALSEARGGCLDLEELGVDAHGLLGKIESARLFLDAIAQNHNTFAKARS